VVEDLLGAVPQRFKGVLTGMAAGIKISPALFLLYLMAVGRRRAAVRCACAIAATIGLAAWFAPAATRAYFTGVAFELGRVASGNSLMHPGNQSLDAVIWRWAGPGGNALGWATLSIGCVAFALTIARRFTRRGELLPAVGAVCLAMLLAAPVSWTHHWVWALPATVAVAARGRASGGRAPGGRAPRQARRWIVAALVIVFVSRFNVWSPHLGGDLGWLGRTLVWNSYVICGLVLLALLYIDSRTPPAAVASPEATARRPALAAARSIRIAVRQQACGRCGTTISELAGRSWQDGHGHLVCLDGWLHSPEPYGPPFDADVVRGRSLNLDLRMAQLRRPLETAGARPGQSTSAPAER
jgi:alpha-1,2-mannosyltransferase